MSDDNCSCNCSCNCTPPIQICPINPPPQFPYNVPYTGTEEPIASNWTISQSTPTAQFSTNPNWPLNTGSNHSQIQTNQQAKAIFVSINDRKANGTLIGTGMPIFKSHHEKILYIQAQYSQAVYLPKQGINTLFS